VAAILSTVGATPARAAVRTCAVIMQVRTNLNALQALVRATPHLSVQQVKRRSNAVKFRELSLELGNNKRIVPKDLDDSFARVTSLLRQAAARRTRRDAGGYRSSLAASVREMRTAWQRFRRFQGNKRC
ncbi:MAG: hypothetical protein DLM70_19105, partial [Chloroflexi bacterium]